MADTDTIKKIEKKIEQVKNDGHGEVVVKIKNGRVYRTLQTFDELEKNNDLDKTDK